MGWLDELKERVALGEDADREKYYVTSVNLATLARLIAIAEGCIMRGKVNNLHCCPICERAPVYKNENYHAQNCSYHEDWKP